jgi:hypothetical protein
MEGLSKSVADLIVYEHPSQSKDVDKAILRELSSLLFKSVSLTFHFILNCRFLVFFLKGFFCFFCRYSQAFDGVVLAYSVEPQDKCARILSGVHPYFGVRLQANMLIFSPKPNMLLGFFLASSCEFSVC